MAGVGEEHGFEEDSDKDGVSLRKSTADESSDERSGSTAGATTTTTRSSSVFASSLSAFLVSRRVQRGKQAPSPSRMASFGINLKRVARFSSRNLNISLARCKLYNSFPNLARKDISQHELAADDENVRKVLKAVESDHVVATNAEENRKRRTVCVTRSGEEEKFGFTIQSYAFRHARTGETERITYVDYVDLGSRAFLAGLRAGDVILAINGQNVQEATHKQLVSLISQCCSLRMVVLFEDCVNRIDLCAKATKLKRLLADKEFELQALCFQEDRILSGLAPLTNVEILASMRTPCHTPRSVSFSLRGDEMRGPSRCADCVLAQLQSMEAYCVDGCQPPSNGSERSDDVHDMEIDNAVVPSSGASSTNEGGFVFSVNGDSEASSPSSARKVDWIEYCSKESTNEPPNGEDEDKREDSVSRYGDLAFVHVLHIDDAASSVTRF